MFYYFALVFYNLCELLERLSLLIKKKKYKRHKNVLTNLCQYKLKYEPCPDRTVLPNGFRTVPF